MDTDYLKQIFVFLSLACGIVAYAIYLRGMYKRQIHPHCFSWLIGGLMTWIAFGAQIQDHAGPGAWTNFLTAFMCSLIGTLALRYGKRDITATDWLSLAGCFVCILSWVVTRNPALSVVLLVLIDAMSMYPTYRKTYHRPEEESVLTWGLNTLKFIFGSLALDKLSIASDLFLFSNVILCGGVTVLIFWRRSKVP